MTKIALVVRRHHKLLRLREGDSYPSHLQQCEKTCNNPYRVYIQHQTSHKARDGEQALTHREHQEVRDQQLLTWHSPNNFVPSQLADLLIRPLSLPCPLGIYRPLNIQKSNIFGVSLNEGAAKIDILAHKHREEIIRCCGISKSYLNQDSVRRIHSGVPQLLSRHFS